MHREKKLNNSIFILEAITRQRDGLIHFRLEILP